MPYRIASLRRNRTPPKGHHRALGMVLLARERTVTPKRRETDASPGAEMVTVISDRPSIRPFGRIVIT